MTFSIDLEIRLIRLEGSGRVTDEDMLECVKAMRSDSRLEPDMNTLSDMRGIEVGFTSQGVRRLVDVMRMTAEKRKAAKAAIVVSADVAFGMGRMLEILSDERVEPRFRIFRDFDEAREWLGSDSLPPAP